MATSSPLENVLRFLRRTRGLETMQEEKAASETRLSALQRLWDEWAKPGDTLPDDLAADCAREGLDPSMSLSELVTAIATANALDKTLLQSLSDYRFSVEVANRIHRAVREGRREVTIRETHAMSCDVLDRVLMRFGFSASRVQTDRGEYGYKVSLF